MKFSARFILIFFVFSICYLILNVRHSNAQAPLVNVNSNQTQEVNSYVTPNNNPDVPKNLHTWTQNVMIEVMSTLACQLTGIDPVSPNQKCLGVDRKTGKIGFVENGGGAIGMMGNMISMLYTPPFHSSDYFNYLASNFGIAKPAYAQSLGFQKLSPLANLWIVFRNLVYLLFVIVFTVIGVAIMLRIKIDARTVMSIENQIPKIIIALLLVTFSFAIVGFLIDLMYVVIYLIFNIFSDPSISKNPDTPKMIANASQSFNSDNVLGFFNQSVRYFDLVTYSSGAVKDVVRNLFSNSTPDTSPWTALLARGTDFFGFLIGGLAGMLTFLIIAVALLWALFKLWFELIKAYVFILIDVVGAPFWIITGVFPGGVGFGGWLRDLLSNLAVFPLTILMFLMGRVFMTSFSGNFQPLFVPPLIGNAGDAQAIGSIVGMGVIFMTPQVLTMMKDALKAPEFKYVAAIGQAMGTGTGIVANTGKGIGGAITQSREYRINKFEGNQAKYEKTGIARSVLGRIFGR